jgi:hypothetical protein
MDDARKRVGEMKGILDRFVRAEKLSSDDAEREFDAAAAQVRGLPREGVLEILDRATGRSKARKRAAVNVLCGLTDLPEAVSRLFAELSSPDWRVRDWVLQNIPKSAWPNLTSELNRIMLHDPDEMCQRTAIGIASSLRLSACFSTVLALAESGFPYVNSALQEYGREEGRPYLRRMFESPVDPNPKWLREREFTGTMYARERDEWLGRKGSKVIAAWGLAKLGDREALEYLGQMLYDPDFQGPTFGFWGHSLRAAQALADLFDLPFEWNADYVEPIRRWWEQNKDRLLGRQS